MELSRTDERTDGTTIKLSRPNYYVVGIKKNTFFVILLFISKKMGRERLSHALFEDIDRMREAKLASCFGWRGQNGENVLR